MGPRPEKPVALSFAWKYWSLRWDSKWNSPSQWNFLGKKGIPLEVFLFSRFYRNDRNIAEPFASTPELCSVITETCGLYCSICRKTLTFFSIHVESAQAVVLFHFGGKLSSFFQRSGKRSKLQRMRLARITYRLWFTQFPREPLHISFRVANGIEQQGTNLFIERRYSLWNISCS